MVLSLAINMPENKERKDSPKTAMPGARLSISNRFMGILDWMAESRSNTIKGKPMPKPGSWVPAEVLCCCAKRKLAASYRYLHFCRQSDKGIFEVLRAAQGDKILYSSERLQPTFSYNSDFIRKRLGFFKIVRGENDGDLPF